jgi:hypothetical protein
MPEFDSLDRGGEDRVLGLLPRTVGVGDLLGAPHYSEKFQAIPRDKWKPMTTAAEIKAFVDRYIALGFHVDDEDQDGIGSCGAASCSILTMLRKVQQGVKYTRLAAGRLYHYSGGGRDGGSTLSDNLKYAMDLGIPELTAESQLLDYRSGWTAAEKASALRGKILESCDCPDFDALASAVQLDWDVQHGIFVGRNYDVRSDGLWINPPSGQSGGHAQATPAGGLCYDGKQYGLLTAGSWSSRFGYKGWYVIPEAYFQQTGFNDGWAVRLVVTPSDETFPPVPK